MNNKIEKAIKEGSLVDWNKAFDSYPKVRQEGIKAQARYILAAMELRKLRREMKLSQGKLARRMNVKREFISRIETGRQNITLDTLLKVATVTGKEFKFWFE